VFSGSCVLDSVSDPRYEIDFYFFSFFFVLRPFFHRAGRRLLVPDVIFSQCDYFREKLFPSPG